MDFYYGQEMTNAKHQQSGNGAAPVPEDQPRWIKFFVDGGILMAARHSRRTRGVYWSMLCEDPACPQKEMLIRKQDLKYRSNNDAEWLAVREGLLFAAEHYPTLPVVIYSDSQLVVKQFNGQWRAKVARHHQLMCECREIVKRLRFVGLVWQPRAVLVQKLGH